MRIAAILASAIALLVGGAAAHAKGAPEAAAETAQKMQKIRIGGKSVEFTLKKVSAHRWTSNFRAAIPASASKLSEYFSVHQMKICRDMGRPHVDLERVSWEPRITEIRAKEDRFVSALETQWSCAASGRGPAAVETQISIRQNICAHAEDAATKKLCTQLQGESAQGTK